MSIVFWWIRQILFALAACFFLLFGVQLLIMAYRLDDPFLFIMTFFSSNLIILISGTLLFVFLYKMTVSQRETERPNDEEY